MTAKTRFRVERCAAHGIAIGLCTVGTCKGAAEANDLGRQLVRVLTPRRCSICKQERGDAVKRGEFYGAKGDHPGYQRYLCDGCWGRKLAKEAAAAAAPPSRASYRDRAAEDNARRLRQQAAEEEIAYD